MNRTARIAAFAALAALAAGSAFAQAKRAPRSHAAAEAEAPAYARDVITVASNERHNTPASATCVVWANAEGLGVGPEQLGGFHGISFNINPRPLAGELDGKPSTTADGLKAVRAQTPPPPAWLVAAIERNAAKIDAACGEEHLEPFVIARLTARDKAG